MTRGQRGRRARPEVGWQVPAPLRQSKLADQLCEQILAKLVSGALPEGGKLPSEGQLCELFGVSRPVVREALSRLQADGVVISRHGSGSFVQRRPNQAFAQPAPIGSVADVIQLEHIRVFAAIKDEDAARAREAMRTHIDNARMRMLTDSTEP